MDRILVDGFVREIEQLLQDQIVPIDIYHVCFDFYFSTKFMYFLTSKLEYQSGSNNIEKTMSVANIDTKKQWNCKVFDIANQQTNILDPSYFIKSSVNVSRIPFL